MKSTWSVAWLLITAVSGCADLPSAQRAFREQDYESARRHWAPLAERGFPKAQVGMGRLIEMGLIEGAAPEDSLKYYLQAYDNGYLPAAYRIGLYYLRKQPPSPANDRRAYEWFRRAVQATQSPGSRLALADMLRQGKGVTRNVEKAMAIYRQLSQEGVAAASRRLAKLYEQGETVAQNHAKALEYYRLALAQGDQASDLDIARYLARGCGTPADPDQARDIYRRHAEEGNPQAAFALARLLESSAAGHDEALQWYRRAAEGGHVGARLRLADAMLENGSALYNPAAALSELEALSNQGVGAASHRLGKLYARGEDIPRNLETAEHFFSLAVSQGYSKSELELAELYAMEGKGNPRALDKALQLYRKHAENGDPEAALALARLLDQSHHREEALHWYTLAAGGGLPAAQYELARLLLDLKRNGQAREWLNQAAASAYGPALLDLGKHIFAARARGADESIEGLTLVMMAAHQNTPGAIPAMLDLMARMPSLEAIDRANRQAKARLLRLAKAKPASPPQDGPCRRPVEQ